MDSKAVVTAMSEHHGLPPECYWNIWLWNIMGTFCCTGKASLGPAWKIPLRYLLPGPQAKSDTVTPRNPFEATYYILLKPPLLCYRRRL